MGIRTTCFVTDLVAEVGSLPSVAAQVVNLTADPDCDMRALTRLIRSDSVLAMRFLALANSAAFGHGQEIRDLGTALVRLGTRRVRNVALMMGIHDMVPRDQAGVGLDLTLFWQHCLAVASCAQSLAALTDPKDRDDAWLVGILYGLGLSALAQRRDSGLDRALDLARRQGCSLIDAEIRTLEFHHGELGARILHEWNLPDVFGEAIEFYAEDFGSTEVSPAAQELIVILRRAIAIARAIGFDGSGDGDPPRSLAALAAAFDLGPTAVASLAAEVDDDVRTMAGLIGLDPPADLFAKALAASRQELARVGLEGLDNALVKEDLEGQMAAAREIQNHILPPVLPVIDGIDMAAINRPSKIVSGDTYDCLRLEDDRFGFLIADVSGKGMPAALLASTLQASIRALSRVIADPGELLAAANSALCQSTDDESFATVFVGVLAPDGGSLRYASAAHAPPLLHRADGAMEWLDPSGTPLGMFPDADYPVSEVGLAGGDALVAYTDGITEATAPGGAEFSARGLAEVVAARGAGDAAAIVAALVAAVGVHTAAPSAEPPASGAGDPSGPAPTDDLTLVVLRRVPDAADGAVR